MDKLRCTLWGALFAVTGNGATIHVPADHADLKDAVAAANANADPSNTIIVAPGTHPASYQVHITKTLTIIGSGAANTVIVPTSNTATEGGDSGGWILASPGIHLTIRDLTLDGTGFLIGRGVRSYAKTVLQGCVIKNIRYNENGPDYAGMGFQVLFNNAYINGNTFVGFGRIGMYVYGPQSTDSKIVGNVFVGKGNGNHLDYGVEVEGDATVEIAHNSFFNCRGVATVDNSTSAGILATTFFDEPGPEVTTVYIHHNRFIGNSDGLVAGLGHPVLNPIDDTVLIARYNNFGGGGFGAIYVDPTCATNADVRWNWYSHKSGPGGLGPGTGDAIDGQPTQLFAPWLVAPVNQFSLPVDLNGGYIMPRANVAEAMTMPVGGQQVNEMSGGIGAIEGTFTPFSDATKPPSLLAVNLLNAGFECIVELSGELPDADSAWIIGATEGWLTTTGGAYVRIERDSGAYTFQLFRWDGGAMGPLVTDTSGSSRFRIVVTVDGSGAASGVVTAFDKTLTMPFATNPEYSLGSVSSVMDDPAFFVVRALGGNLPVERTARMDVSCFSTTGASNAMYLFADDPYVRNSESIEYRLGITGVSSKIAGYQAFLSNPTPATQGGLGARIYTDSPFPFRILPFGLRADGGVDFFVWSGVFYKGTDARFRFDPPLSDGVARLVIDPDNGNPLVPTRISADGGGAIVPTRYASNTVVIDSVKPTLTSLSAVQVHGNVLNGAQPTVQGPLTISVDAADAVNGSGLEGHPLVDIDFAPAGPSAGDIVGARMSPFSGNTFHYIYNVTPTTPCGTATITVRVKDDAENDAIPASGTLSINTTQIDITVALAGGFASTTFTRGVHFWIGNAGLGTYVGKNVFFSNGIGYVTINALDNVNLPCGPGLGPTIAAKDPLHTITRTMTLTHNGNGQYTASFTGSNALISGDCWGPAGMPDDVIDILDFGKFASMFGTQFGHPNTPLGTPPAHPDFSGDAVGLVGTADYTFIQVNFLQVGDSLPGNFVQEPRRPKKAASVKEMLAAKIRFADEMDLDGDGWVTYDEITRWLVKRMGG